MVQYHKFSKTKTSGSGGHKRMAADKQLLHYGGFESKTKLMKDAAKDAKEVRELKRMKGGNKKVVAKQAMYANLVVQGKSKKVKITNVKATPSNRHYARENIIVKGAIIETEAGQARVTSRPGQDGVVNAILVKN